MEATKVVATRLLKLETEDGEVPVPIRFLAPEQEGDAWACRYEIDWTGGTQSMDVGGSDSMQALVMRQR
jgi:hypothetical protein